MLWCLCVYCGGGGGAGKEGQVLLGRNMIAFPYFKAA